MIQRAWVISVNMGYGHQRTAFPLKGLGQVINANDYPGIFPKDRKIWETTRKIYEAVSRFSRIPLVGEATFSAYDKFQRILSFYPKRDLSQPNFILKKVYSLFRKGWGKHLIDELKTKNYQLKINPSIISTFSTPAFMAEVFGYPGDIFCVICDADISRGWAPLDPKNSKIKYFAPNERAVERLKLYGVSQQNIFLTGYPLPLENIGSQKMEILKDDLRTRLLNLDPLGKYCKKYKSLIKAKLGNLPKNSGRPLTVMFSVGGAGAQKEIGLKILKSLEKEIKAGRIGVILSAGVKKKVIRFFKERVEDYGRGVKILFGENIEEYFQKFNEALKGTDILWTKPSELSFYSALGIPIIVSPPIGSQEEFNRRWLLKSGFGLSQEDPKHADQWLFDWLKQGYLAEAAMQGFVKGEKLGTYNIKRIISG